VNYEEAFKHLRKDPVMKYLIQKMGSEIDLYDRYNENLARALADLIIEQQISFKAAITIKNRFSDLTSNLSNKEILKLDNHVIQSIGISFRKVEYIKNIFYYFLNSNFDFESATDQEIETELRNIKGVGVWTVEMFMIFILFRMDIFSKGDIALINSIKINYKIDDLGEEKLDEIINKWSPFKTIASLLLWKSIETKEFYSNTLDLSL
jgi:DNA-3-methyladenine glycosylase II